MDYVPEQSTYIVTASFTSDTGAAVQPNTIQYRIDDMATDGTIQADTAITPSGNSQDIVITALQNTVLNRTNPQEVKRLTVWATYTRPDQSTGNITAEYLYTIQRLAEIDK